MLMPPTYNKYGHLNVTVETPKNSDCKYDYDPGLKLFRVAKTLPLGHALSVRFWFHSRNAGGGRRPPRHYDLVKLFVGALAGVSIIGMLEAEQREKDKKKPILNNRLVGSLRASADDPDTVFSDALDLPKLTQVHVEAFFIEYNRLSGKEFKSIGWHSSARAKSLLDDGIKKAKKAQ